MRLLILILGVLGPRSYGESCPQGPRAWEARRLNLVEALWERRPDSVSVDYLPKERAAEIFSQITACVAAAPAEFRPQLEACLSRPMKALEMIKAWGLRTDGERDDSSYGFSRADAQYLRLTEDATRVPPELQSPDFLAAVESDDENAVTQVLEAIKRRRTPPILYTIYAPSVRIIRGKRLILFFPADRTAPDRWMAINLGSRRNFSVVGVVPNGSRWSVYFRDHERRATGDHVSVTSPTRAVFAGSCQSCHYSGLLFPHAAEGTTPSGQFGEIVRAMERYGNIQSFGGAGGAEVPADFPPLGERQTNQLNRLRAVDACVERLKKDGESPPTTERTVAIMNAMNCRSCHNGRIRGRILPPFGPIVASHLSSGVMPPNSGLSTRERAVLNCSLQLEYFGDSKQPGVINEYLNETKCHVERPEDAERQNEISRAIAGPH